MAIEIRKVDSKSDLKKFIRFNYELYKDNPYSVPDLYEDMLKTFSPGRNAALEFCEADYFLALRDGKIVGRVAAIINHRANETWNTHSVRFGWIDFIDDREVSAALLRTVEQWGRERGMTEIVGPLGFTDLDAEGMLIYGFDQLSTMSTIYHIRKIKSKRELKKTGLAYKIFDLINEAYAPLYGFSRMTNRQVDQYVREYFPLLDLRMVTVVEDENNEPVAVGVSMPSISRALQKAKGKLFPFGWFHLLKALFFKHPDTLDLLLVGVKTEYQSKGVNALLFTDLIPIYMKMGFKYGETNPELESNSKVQAQWKYLDGEIHKRRRCYRKNIG